jgi:hypothetical protein
MFKTGQLIRRVRIHEDIPPIVPLGGVVRVTEDLPSRRVRVMKVILLMDYNDSWKQGDEITVDRDHYVPVVKLSKRKPINEN